MPYYFYIWRNLAFDRRGVIIVNVKTVCSERVHFLVDVTAGIKRENDRFSAFH